MPSFVLHSLAGADITCITSAFDHHFGQPNALSALTILVRPRKAVVSGCPGAPLFRETSPTDILLLYCIPVVCSRQRAFCRVHFPAYCNACSPRRAIIAA